MTPIHIFKCVIEIYQSGFGKKWQVEPNAANKCALSKQQHANLFLLSPYMRQLLGNPIKIIGVELQTNKSAFFWIEYKQDAQLFSFKCRLLVKDPQSF
jgi:hypothetical protein